MAELLTAAGTAHRLEQLVASAQSRLVLISPFLQIPQILFERLCEAATRGVIVTVVCREGALKAEQRELLAKVAGLEFRHMPNLHAKCFLSESGVVIGSMNAYEYSEVRNRELGVYYDASEPLYSDAAREVDSILAASYASTPSKSLPASDAAVKTVFGPRSNGQEGGMYQGHCIRCGDGVPLNPLKPFCYPCFLTWTEYGNYDYPERHCHDCGRIESTTMAKPICRACFARSRPAANVR